MRTYLVKGLVTDLKDNNKNNNNAFFNNKNSYGMISANNNNEDEYAYKNLPMGLSMAFTQNAAAMTAFENMDNQKKKQIIEKASKVSSKKEMFELVQSISTNSI